MVVERTEQSKEKHAEGRAAAAVSMRLFRVGWPHCPPPPHFFLTAGCRPVPHPNEPNAGDPRMPRVALFLTFPINWKY